MVTNYSQELTYEELESSEGASKKGINFSPYIRLLKRKAWLIGGLTMIGALAGYAWNGFSPHTYVGNFYLLVEPITPSARLSDPSTLARTGGVPQDDLFALDYPTNLAFLQSPGMTYRIANDVFNKDRSRSLPAVWKDIRENLKVERLGDTRATATKIFSVTFTGKNPKDVQKILETAADTFLKYSSEDRETSLKAGVKFIDRQLPSLQERLSKLQDQQEQLRKKYELLDPQIKGQQVLESVGSLQGQLLTIESDLKAQRSLYASLKDQLNLDTREALVSSSLNEDPKRANLVEKLQEIDNQIATQKALFTENSPVIQNLLEQRDNINKLLQESTQDILTKNGASLPPTSPAFGSQSQAKSNLIQQMIEADNKIKALEEQKKLLTANKIAIEEQAKRYPDIIRKYQDLERQVNLTTQILDRLQTQKETLKVESAQELPWQLISKPQIPIDANGQFISYPPKPTKKLGAGMGAGLLLGLITAFLVEKRRNTFYEAQDVGNKLGVPLLSKIPYDRTTEKGAGSLIILNPLADEQPEGKQQVFNTIENLQTDKEFAFQNAFNYLYNQLFVTPKNPEPKSIGICSVAQKDGQTTTTFYLAKVAATNGKKVLVVDTNWLNPQIHKLFNVANDEGIYNILKDNIDPSKVIQPALDQDNLYILTSGFFDTDTKKGFWSKKMQEVMKNLENKFDLIIYDLPHFYDSSDVSFIASNTDGVILVVAVNKTPASLVMRAGEELKEFSIPLLGVVVNNLSDAQMPLL